MQHISVQLDRPVRPMMPVHGVNNGPKSCLFTIDQSQQFITAGIPYTRLHDTEYPYGSGHFVDVPCIFPDFEADPADPASYDFTLTDQYITAIKESKSEVFYRLGVSIEHASKKYHIFPPKDNLKWAKICVGIIRHYNEGWADGFHYNIRYWEIWNEPENPPMWQGTKEQYFELYKVASTVIKEEFPELKVGGYASCGFYALTRENPSPFYKGFVTYFTDFLTFVAEEHLPLDFFSWHLYTTDPDEIANHARYVRKTLDTYGFYKTESILDEWNYVPDSPDRFKRMKKMEAAAFVASALCVLQQEGMNMAHYYDAQPHMRYCGLFDFESVQKPFYAFSAFGDLYRLKTQVYSTSDCPKIKTCAAATDQEAAILVSSMQAEPMKLMIDFSGFSSPEGIQTEDYILNEAEDLMLKRGELFLAPRFQSVIEMAPQTVLLVKLRKQNA